MTDQEANEIERREWAEKMAKREAVSNANFSAGVSSLDSHIMDVEASGEDKKHEALGYMSKPAKRLIEAGHSISTLISANRCDPDDCPIYTQSQRDAYAAEAVKQERERDRWIKVADRMPPPCHTIIAYGRKYGSRWPTKNVYSTYTGTRPLETVEDEEITHWQFQPDSPKDQP
jgi:hypothetical protein